MMSLEAYDSPKLWAVSRDNCHLPRYTSLEPLLSSMKKVTESSPMIGVVEKNSCDSLLERWRCPGDYDIGSDGGVGPRADYHHYNIQTNGTCTENEAYSLIHRTLENVPDGHPRGIGLYDCNGRMGG